MSVKGIVVTTDNKISVQQYEEPLYKTIGKTVGGYIEIVRPRGLPDPYCMVVNEEGLLMDLPLNITGSKLYGTQDHGFPIVGNIVILAEGETDDGIDLISVPDNEIDRMISALSLIGGSKNERN